MTTAAQALLESDRLYFELAARSRPIDARPIDARPIGGGVFQWMPGLETVPGSAVVQGVSPGSITLAPEEWVAAATEVIQDVGCTMARIYLLTSVPEVDAALAAAGFTRRTEIGYLTHTSIGPDPSACPPVTLRPLDTDTDWEVKRKLHALSNVASDGHATDPDDWVELERRKCSTGKMVGFLVEVDGQACGSVATLDCGNVLRAKNLFVHPDRRRQGIAAQTMRCISQRAVELGRAAAGVFGVEGNPGNAVYQRLRMAPAVRQFEWSKPLPG